jgi:hypothetical protein
VPGSEDAVTVCLGRRHDKLRREAAFKITKENERKGEEEN